MLRMRTLQKTAWTAWVQEHARQARLFVLACRQRFFRFHSLCGRAFHGWHQFCHSKIRTRALLETAWATLRARRLEQAFCSWLLVTDAAHELAEHLDHRACVFYRHTVLATVLLSWHAVVRPAHRIGCVVLDSVTLSMFPFTYLLSSMLQARQSALEQHQQLVADTHHEMNLLRRSWLSWLEVVQAELPSRIALQTRVHDFLLAAKGLLVQHCWKSWKEYHVVRQVRQVLVGRAVVHFSTEVCRRSLRRWAIWTSNQRSQLAGMQAALMHWRRRLCKCVLLCWGHEQASKARRRCGLNPHLSRVTGVEPPKSRTRVWNSVRD